MRNQVNSKIKYYSYFLRITAIIIIAISIMQVFRSVNYYIDFLLFVLFESYFVLRTQLIAIRIDNKTITLTYFQYLRRTEITSTIGDCKIEKGDEISFRSSEKKFTLYFKVKNKKFKVNRLDGFDENELEDFYETYLKNLN